MRVRSILGRLIVGAAIMAWPVIGSAQEATLSGTVTDTTGGVLPGVTVRAVHEASGNTFEVVTDARGGYRMPVRTGTYRMTVGLTGFVTVTRTGLELLVGQQAVVNFEMSVSAVEESVTVTGEVPLIDPTQSRMSGNIDPRQMQELPLLGRNWQELSLLAPGSRANAVTDSPQPGTQDTGQYQLNVDGQTVTQTITSSAFGGPRYSRDAIAEFELVANRFDATQGRSTGVQVNAVTKSGTNTPSGTFSSYFRDDRFNAADFIQDRVLPYSNQQVSATFGGPIRRDRMHFFVNYEYEREPQTITYSTPYPRFNAVDQSDPRREKKALVRLDVQMSPQTRLMVRGSKWDNLLPFDPRYSGGATKHPSAAIAHNRHMNQLFSSLTHVISNRAVNEVKVGYAGYHYTQEAIVNDPRLPPIPGAPGNRAIRILLRGFAIGPEYLVGPSKLVNEQYQVRDDLTYSFTKRGRHDVRLGGEYIYAPYMIRTPRLFGGVLDARNGPVPDNIEDLFPVWNDPTTWNLAALSPITRTYTLGVGDPRVAYSKNIYGAWVQDDWAIMPRLTLNLGLRYDLETNVWANSVAIPPFLEAGRPNDTNNFGPRFGAAFTLNDRTVLRGGYGKYFQWIGSGQVHFTHFGSQIAYVEVVNDKRADFAADPFNGSAPTYEQAIASAVRRRIDGSIASPDARVPYAHQASAGVQRQLGSTMSLSADYLYTGARDGTYGRNINLAYDPTTGANYPFTNISRLPYPAWGPVSMQLMGVRSNYHALEVAFRKRMNQGWQVSGNYLLSGLWDNAPQPYSGLQPVPFELARDIAGEYSLAVTDQRHRAVFNGIWQLPYDFQLSGLYFFGSGERLDTTYGGDLRRMGSNVTNRLRPDGTIVPRNAFVGEPIHRVDLRIQHRFRVGGRTTIDGILEIFNVLNHANYGSYTTDEANRNYGKPSQHLNNAYQPRKLQLGFRVAF